ncbi:Protein-associating with the carboxyl-terminal domain of ezrin [Sparganum proliferum]
MVLEILKEQDYDAAGLSPVLEKSCLHESPKERLSASKLLLHSIFKGSYSMAFSFLSNYMLKSDSEKFLFFENFPSLIEDIPEDLFCNSIVPFLLSPSIFTDFPSQRTVGLLLTPFKDSEGRSSTGFISESAFRRLLGPRITLLFQTHELNTRLLLLKHFSSYARLLGSDALQRIILPEVCLGLYDACDTLVTASLTGLSQLATILGPGPVLSHLSSLGDQLKSRGLLNFEPPPPQSNHSTTNTTISLGRGRTVRYTPTSRAWRRCANLFPDSAPKVSAQARDAVNTAAAPPPRRLRDVAALSANYTPPVVAPSRVSLPPVTKTSRPHNESQRTFSTIFASLENSSAHSQVGGRESNSPELLASDANRSVNASVGLEADVTSSGSESKVPPPSTAAYVVVNGEAASPKTTTERQPTEAWNDWNDDDDDAAAAVGEEDEEDERVRTQGEQTVKQNDIDEVISSPLEKISLNDSETAAVGTTMSHQPESPPLNTALQMRLKQEAQVAELLAELEPPVSFTSVPMEERPAPEVPDKPSILRYQADPAPSDWGNGWGDDEEL